MTYDFNIQSHNLTLKYKNFDALKNISFKLDSKKIYGLLGRNGAGKTSLLSIISSFRQPTDGYIKINNEIPFENQNIMQNIGFYYEKNYSEETDTISQLLNSVKKYKINYDEEYSKYLLDLFKLPANIPVYKFSKGMQAALETTIGLASRCPITIFDESYLGMDAPTRVKFYQEILADQERNPRTFILSTHLVSEMDYLFDEVLILHKGRLILQEEYETLISRGYTIIGSSQNVDEFTKDMKIINEQYLGSTKAVMIYQEKPENLEKKANEYGLEVSSIPLQELFIHLTEKEDVI